MNPRAGPGPGRELADLRLLADDAEAKAAGARMDRDLLRVI